MLQRDHSWRREGRVKIWSFPTCFSGLLASLVGVACGSLGMPAGVLGKDNAMSIKNEFEGDDRGDALVMGPRRNVSHSRLCYKAGQMIELIICRCPTCFLSRNVFQYFKFLQGKSYKSSVQEFHSSWNSSTFCRCYQLTMS